MTTFDTQTSAPAREKVRVFMTGDCEGLADLRHALERHLEVDFVGSSDNLAEAASALRGGHLNVVLHERRTDRDGGQHCDGTVATLL